METVVASRMGTALCVVLICAGAAAPRPMEVPSSEWPLERIVENLERVVDATPEDGEAHYHLGRAYGFAFALERSSLWAAWEGAELLSDLSKQQERFSGKPGDSVDPARALERLAAGVFHLRRACEIDAVPADLEGERLWAHNWSVAREHLTFAWLLETGAHLAERMDTPRLLGLERPALELEESRALERWIDDLGSADTARAAAAQRALAAPERLEKAVAKLMQHMASSKEKRQKAVVALLERYWLERSIAEYWHAFQQNIESDLSPERHEFELAWLVSYEALLGYERLVRQRGDQSPEEEQRLQAIPAMKERLEAHPRERTFITPLVVSMRCNALDELVTSNLTVPFDLDGDAVDEIWPWIMPDAGWLVWDPKHRGEITSGRQLFGTASAWLFFEDGYRVLDALDDERDGELRGGELAGISVWFDRDTDGVSDRGEVVPVEELGIVALSTQATMKVGASPANLCGLEMSDGRVLPTYDWVLAPVEGP